MHQPTPSPPTDSARKRTHSLMILAAATVVVLCSILVLAFDANAILTYRTNSGNYLSTMMPNPNNPNNADDGLELAQYPLYLYIGGMKGILISACFSLVLASSISLLWVFVHRRAKALLLSDYQRLGLFLALDGECILSLAVLVLSYVHHFQSGRFDPTYRSSAVGYEEYGPNYQYDGASFDLGSWSCQVSTYGGFDDSGHLLSRQCTDSMAVLSLGLLLTLTNVAMALLVWVDWKGQRTLIRGYRDLMNEIQLDYLGEGDE